MLHRLTLCLRFFCFGRIEDDDDAYGANLNAQYEDDNS